MTKLRKGTVADKADIIDFINCVFSQDKFPHDFKKMVPKCYADESEGLCAEHYMVVEDGKIKALVLLYKWLLEKRSLSWGLLATLRSITIPVERAI